MDSAASLPSSVEYQSIPDQSSPGEFPLSDKPYIALHLITSGNLSPQDLAALEVTCPFFRQPANLAPDEKLSLVELAALEMCLKKAMFIPMTVKQKQEMKKMCGGSWKLVLKYLLAGEVCSRRGKAHAVAGPGHCLVVTNSGGVYSFGSNTSGQLGHGTTEQEPHPRLIRSLQGIRIIQAVAGPERTMLVSDAGLVYATGMDYFRQNKRGPDQGNKLVTTPRLVDSLKDIFVVQVAIGNSFTAVLSRERRVYTFGWSSVYKLGHESELVDLKPRRLLGPLDRIPVVQISGGSCYLRALAYQPCGMSVYSVGCGYGGKLGHGTEVSEKQPKLIKEFKILNLEPVMVMAGFWHATVVGKDGRVCTWGWNARGCLGHRNDCSVWAPKVVEALINVKVVHVAAGYHTTFVVSDDGDVYSFGCETSSNLEHDLRADVADNQVWTDPWHGVGIWKKVIPANWTNWGIPADAKVGSVCKNGKWTGPDAPDMILGWILQNMPMHAEVDEVKWVGNIKAKFSVKEVYSILQQRSSTKRWADLLENSICPPKHKMMLWIALNKGLLTRDKTWIKGNKGCCFCDQLESLNHLYFECEFSQDCIKIIDREWGGIWEWEGTEFSMAAAVMAGRWKTDSWGPIKRGVIAGIVYTIWLERNARIFGGKSTPPGEIMRRFMAFYAMFIEAKINQNDGNLGEDEYEYKDVPIPKLVSSLKQTNERVVQISTTTYHTFALTDSDKLYVFGANGKGQLGVVIPNHPKSVNPERVNIDLC